MTKLQTYYKPERMPLEHFRFLEVFFRQTKKAYISFVSHEILETVDLIAGEQIPSYNAIRLAARREVSSVISLFAARSLLRI